jgi:hypothetical protein
MLKLADKLDDSNNSGIDLYYDESISYEEQLQDVKDFISNSIKDYNRDLSFNEQTDVIKDFIKFFCEIIHPYKSITELAGVYPRPLKEWYRVDIYDFIKTYIYAYPANSDMNGIISSTNIERNQ